MTFRPEMPMAPASAMNALAIYHMFAEGKKNYSRVFSERRTFARKVKFCWQPGADRIKMKVMFEINNIPYHVGSGGLYIYIPKWLRVKAVRAALRQKIQAR